MRHLKIRIGTKLGVSAFVGLVLVAGMVGNQARVNRVTQDLMNQAALSRDLQQAALEARIKLNELISIDRDIRLAKTCFRRQLRPAASEEPRGRRQLGLRQRDRDRGQGRRQAVSDRAKGAFNNYIAAAQEIARLQHEIIGVARPAAGGAHGLVQGVRRADQRRGDRDRRQPPRVGKQSPAGQLRIHARGLDVLEPFRAQRQHADEQHFRCARHDCAAAGGVARHDARVPTRARRSTSC